MKHLICLGLAALACGCAGERTSGSLGASATAPVQTTTQTTTQTATPAPPAVSGWLPYWTYTHGDAAIAANGGRGLDEVNLFGYGLEPDGSISVNRGVEDPQRHALIRATGAELIPTVYDVHDPDALAAVLADPAKQDRAIRALTDLLDRFDYDGLDVDFEHAKTATRDAFSDFVVALGHAVHARGKIYSVTVPGKWRDLPSWGGYDYAALAATADRFKLMTYGYHGTFSGPGPIAPTHWIERVLDYATSTVDPHKLMIAIPFYGYDWPADGSRIRSVTAHTLPSRLARATTPPRFDPAQGETTFTYTDDAGVSHHVWYSDARSMAAKASLVSRYDIRGLSIWALGYGQDSWWDELRAELRK